MDKALEVASLAGHILLENGAEISRVEETMEKIATHYGVEKKDFFVLSNGIFTTGESGYAKVEFIPFKCAQLERVVAVDQLFRDIEKGIYTLDEAYSKLTAIRHSPAKSNYEQLLGSAVGSAGFCAIFGGGLWDVVVAGVVGFILWSFVIFTSRLLSKPLCNIAGGLIGTGLCILFHKLGFGNSLGNMIVGSLIPLIPGVAFINGIRDLAQEDYLAGATRLMDAIMVFFCIAGGVIIAFLGDTIIEGSMIAINGTEPDALLARIPFQAAAAFIGTLGFAILFGAPRRNYIQTAVVATVGWVAYLSLLTFTPLGTITSSFVATVVVTLVSRFFARWFRTPETVFLITGLFPMIPGGGIFWTSFFLVSNRAGMAAQSGSVALGVSAAIVLGVILVSSVRSR